MTVLKADAVFDGGGVKGIALVGALCCLEEKGYVWNNVAGTSAGSMVAAMIAAGYTRDELKKIIFEMDFESLLDKGGLQSIPLLGKPLCFLIDKGIYSGNYIEKWMRNNLKKKGITKFKDVSVKGKSRLKIVAADITKKDLLILPDDLVKYGMDPMEFDIARAVRMSISIPFFFKPVKLKYSTGCSYIVDGGVLSKFPIWIFDVNKKPRWPTIGFKLLGSKVSRTGSGKSDIVSFTLDIIDTMIEEHEEIHLKNKDFVRTIPISTSGTKATEFSLSRKKCTALFNSGYNAANKFIGNWNFAEYVETFRKG
ncbi:MAG: patatin-like phospholipase family protein [Clostridiales bacterium]|nr:patatin-like phospholipase family protein [Clostridiales bacterium]